MDTKTIKQLPIMLFWGIESNSMKLFQIGEFGSHHIDWDLGK